MNLRTASISCLALGALAAQAKEPLNLVVVMADQWRGDALEFLGKEAVRTPNLDRFAQAGIVVGQCVSGYPVSSPAHGMFMTGAYPHVNGVTGKCNSNTAPFGVEFKQEVPCWSDVLAAQGYALGYIGKWHLDSPYKPYIDCSNNKGQTAWNEWCPPERRLFDRTVDPFQLRDIAQQEPQTVAQMHRVLAQKLQKIGDPIAVNL